MEEASKNFPRCIDRFLLNGFQLLLNDLLLVRIFFLGIIAIVFFFLFTIIVFKLCSRFRYLVKSLVRIDFILICFCLSYRSKVISLIVLYFSSTFENEKIVQ